MFWHTNQNEDFRCFEEYVIAWKTSTSPQKPGISYFIDFMIAHHNNLSTSKLNKHLAVATVYIDFTQTSHKLHNSAGISPTPQTL